MYVFNCLWGRFDQVIGNIHQLYCINITAVFIVTEDTIIFTLKPVCYLALMRDTLVILFFRVTM